MQEQGGRLVLLQLSCPVSVLCGGQVAGVVDARTATKEEIGLLMTQHKAGETDAASAILQMRMQFSESMPLDFQISMETDWEEKSSELHCQKVNYGAISCTAA